MDLELKGKAALITGGTVGIGLAVARAFAREGVSTAICGRYFWPPAVCALMSSMVASSRKNRACTLPFSGIRYSIAPAWCDTT